VKLQQVADAAGREDLAISVEIVYRTHQAMAIDGDPQETVAEQVATSTVVGNHRCWRSCPHHPRAHGGDTTTGVWRGVEYDPVAVARAGELSKRGGDELLEFDGNRSVVGHRVAIHPADRGPRQYVVELLEQNYLPQSVEGLVRVRSAVPYCRRRAP
jgi:hypothetical protein